MVHRVRRDPEDGWGIRQKREGSMLLAAGGINKGPEAGLAESFQGLKEGHSKGMEGGW